MWQSSKAPECPIELVLKELGADDVPFGMGWVPGYEGLYSVTRSGDVYSWLNGSWGTRSKPHKLRQRVACQTGYIIVDLWKDKKPRRFGVHRLVLLAFSGSPESGQVAAHLNGIRTDNRIENLTWATTKENSEHMLVHGTSSKGSHRPLAKLTEGQAGEIRSRWRNGEPCTKLAREYGISKSTALRIGQGIAWRHVE
jgi:hypothetical protein